MGFLGVYRPTVCFTDLIGFDRLIACFMGFYRQTVYFIGFYIVLGLYTDLLGFYRLTACFIGFLWFF